MHSDAIQLSHEELLLVLGLLRLPPPLALGPQPAAGYDSATLNAALAGALSGLAARGLLRLGDDPYAAPAPDERLAALARVAAGGDRCLILAERRGSARRAAHLVALGGQLVLHSSPQPRVHRLASLSGASAAAWLVAAMAPPEQVAGPPRLELSAKLLVAAMDAVEAGQGAVARASLLQGGVAPNTAEELLAALGSTPARFALGALRGLRTGTTEARGALVIAGAQGVWWTWTLPDAPLQLERVDQHGLHAHLNSVLAWLALDHLPVAAA